MAEMNETRILKVRVWCQAFYDSEIAVPANMSLEEAYWYAENNLDRVPLTDLTYLEDSDELDSCDMESGHIRLE